MGRAMSTVAPPLPAPWSSAPPPAADASGKPCSRSATRSATTPPARKGVLRLAGGIWSGDVCGFEFADTVYGLAGTATCDWREPRPRLWVDEGVPADQGASAARPHQRRCCCRSTAARSGT